MASILRRIAERELLRQLVLESTLFYGFTPEKAKARALEVIDELDSALLRSKPLVPEAMTRIEAQHALANLQSYPTEFQSRIFWWSSEGCTQSEIVDWLTKRTYVRQALISYHDLTYLAFATLSNPDEPTSEEAWRSVRFRIPTWSEDPDETDEALTDERSIPWPMRERLVKALDANRVAISRFRSEVNGRLAFNSWLRGLIRSSEFAQLSG